MTIEEAIKNREACLAYLEGCGPRADQESVEAVRWSLRALRAYQQSPLDRSRWEGCPACRDGEVIAWDLCNDGIVIESDGKLHMLSGGDWEAEINYCPMCGCPLREEAWSETERKIGGSNGTV